jgi:hypothetical protein
MKRWTISLCTALLPALVACGGGGIQGGGSAKVLSASDKSGRTTGTGHEVSKAAAASFDQALESVHDHDKKGDWSEASCKDISDKFVNAAKSQTSATNRAFPEALYNAGLADQRGG